MLTGRAETEPPAHGAGSPGARAAAAAGTSGPEATAPVETRLAMYRRMLEMRGFEKRANDLFLQGLVKGTSHLGLGQEAIAAAFGQAMRPDDYTFATYRGHNHTLARGVPMMPVMAELMGRAGGLMAGKGGSMHLTSVQHGMMGSYAIVGAHLTIANGAAWSATVRGTDQVAVCFFGDGTTNIGAFHEALNLAVVWKLPVIFVCENNLWMEYTPIGSVTAVTHPAADRAASYGLAPVLADGNDADVMFAGRDRSHRQGPGGRRAKPRRGAHLPPRRALAGRSRQVPPRRRARELARAGPRPRVPFPSGRLGRADGRAGRRSSAPSRPRSSR